MNYLKFTAFLLLISVNIAVYSMIHIHHIPDSLLQQQPDDKSNNDNTIQTTSLPDNSSLASEYIQELEKKFKALQEQSDFQQQINMLTTLNKFFTKEAIPTALQEKFAETCQNIMNNRLQIAEIIATRISQEFTKIVKKNIFNQIITDKLQRYILILDTDKKLKDARTQTTYLSLRDALIKIHEQAPSLAFDPQTQELYFAILKQFTEHPSSKLPSHLEEYVAILTQALQCPLLTKEHYEFARAIIEQIAPERHIIAAIAALNFNDKLTHLQAALKDVNQGTITPHLQQLFTKATSSLFTEKRPNELTALKQLIDFYTQALTSSLVPQHSKERIQYCLDTINKEYGDATLHANIEKTLAMSEPTDKINGLETILTEFPHAFITHQDLEKIINTIRTILTTEQKLTLLTSMQKIALTLCVKREITMPIKTEIQTSLLPRIEKQIAITTRKETLHNALSIESEELMLAQLETMLANTSSTQLPANLIESIMDNLQKRFATVVLNTQRLETRKRVAIKLRDEAALLPQLTEEINASLLPDITKQIEQAMQHEQILKLIMAQKETTLLTELAILITGEQPKQLPRESLELITEALHDYAIHQAHNNECLITVKKLSLAIIEQQQTSPSLTSLITGTILPFIEARTEHNSTVTALERTLTNTTNTSTLLVECTGILSKKLTIPLPAESLTLILVALQKAYADNGSSNNILRAIKRNIQLLQSYPTINTTIESTITQNLLPAIQSSLERLALNQELVTSLELQNTRTLTKAIMNSLEKYPTTTIVEETLVQLIRLLATRTRNNAGNATFLEKIQEALKTIIAHPSIRSEKTQTSMNELAKQLDLLLIEARLAESLIKTLQITDQVEFVQQAIALVENAQETTISSEQLRKLAEKLIEENNLDQKSIEFITNVEKLSNFIITHAHTSAATKRLLSENITPRIFQARETIRLCSAIDQAFALGNHEAVLLAINVIVIESRTNATPLNTGCLERITNVLNSIATQESLESSLIELTKTVTNNLLQQPNLTVQQRSTAKQSILPALETLQYQQYFNKAMQQAQQPSLTRPLMPSQSFLPKSSSQSITPGQTKHLEIAALPEKPKTKTINHKKAFESFLTQ